MEERNAYLDFDIFKVYRYIIEALVLYIFGFWRKEKK